jgi:predicted HicB family RNase H-like nuclease
MEPSKSAVLNLRKFPEDLRRKCKIKALEQGMTLTEFVIRCLREAVEAKRPQRQSKAE